MRAKVIICLALCLVIPTLCGYLFTSGTSVPVVQEPIYHGPGDAPCVALTVNVDWGEEYIPSLLAVSKKKEIPLNHAYSHAHPDRLSVEDNVQEIERAAAVLARITGTRTTLFAPPYGERGPAVLEAAEAAGARVVLTRAGDYDLAPPEMESLWERKKYDLRQRVELANRVGADIYLSIHAHCHSDTRRYGQRVFAAPRAGSEKLAASIDRSLARLTGTCFGVRTGNFYVLRQTTMPAVLVEVGFISNPEERAHLGDPRYRAALAEAIFLGTLCYFENRGP